MFLESFRVVREAASHQTKVPQSLHSHKNGRTIVRSWCLVDLRINANIQIPLLIETMPRCCTELAIPTSSQGTEIEKGSEV